MHGLGTVTGATNISGTGTIQAINLANSNLAAVLTIDGNYFQSGGTFSELLHGTGVQLDKVDVTTGHTVNLTGGNLQLSGVTFALGQVFNDIMTFQPGELTGTFATIQGGGNGTLVDLGNGLSADGDLRQRGRRHFARGGHPRRGRSGTTPPAIGRPTRPSGRRPGRQLRPTTSRSAAPTTAM